MDKLPENEDEAGSSTVSLIANAIGTYLGSVPAALQKNVEKAFSHLLKIPGAYSEGKAEEIKAYSQARVQIIKATGEKLAESIEIDNSLARIATETHTSKILRQQKNSIGVLKYATEELSALSIGARVEPTLKADHNTDGTEEISEDWLNAFESEAVNMSSEQMQQLFGKMLAGEIQRPSTYSVRTVKLMGQMDNRVAKKFRAFCSLTFSYIVNTGEIVDSRLFTLGDKSHRNLAKFDLHWLDIDVLVEYGLLTEQAPFQVSYSNVVLGYHDRHKPTPIVYRKKAWKFKPIAPKTANDFENYFEYGIGLSRVGRELLNIVEPEENEAYEYALRAYLKGQGLEMVEYTAASQEDQNF